MLTYSPQKSQPSLKTRKILGGYHIMSQKQTRSTKKKARRKSLPEKVYPKCIYCQTELTKGKWSKEHVVNRSILPEHNNKLTLIRKVCRECNSGFADIDTAFVENAITGVNKTLMDIINDEDRWNDTQEPFVIKNVTTTIRGDKQVFTVEPNEEQEKNILRGIAKIALNTLIYDFKDKPSQSSTDQGKCHYTCARNDDIFDGYEEELSDIKKYIKEGGKSPVHIELKRIPMGLFDENMDIQRENIPMQNIEDPTHIIVIYKEQSHYYAVVGLFIGLNESAPIYFVPLIGDKNEIDPDCINPEVVRVYNFRHLIKKQPQQEPVTSRTIVIPEGNSAYIITPVNTLEWVYLINMSKNSSDLQKYLEREYRRMT